MTVSELMSRLALLPPTAVVVLMDYRGNLDEMTEVEHHQSARYWPTHRHSAPTIEAEVVELS